MRLWLLLGTLKMTAKTLLLALGLCCTAAQVSALSCEIRFATEGDYVTLEAVVSSESPAEGSYVLGATTISGSNSSTSMQAGPVVIKQANTPVLLARSVHRMTAETILTAQLTIEAQQERTQCRASTPNGKDI